MMSRSHVHEGGDRRDRRDTASLPAPAWTGSRVSSRRDSHGDTSKEQEHLEPPRLGGSPSPDSSSAWWSGATEVSSGWTQPLDELMKGGLINPAAPKT